MGVKITDAPGLRQFLDETVVATLAVPIDEAGTLHIATMHYLHENQPLCFYFVTKEASEKCRLLVMRDNVTAACTVGTVAGVPYSIQMRGTASLLAVDEHPDIMDRYFVKRQTTNRNVEGEGTVIVVFRANWARYTDYSNDWNTVMIDLS